MKLFKLFLVVGLVSLQLYAMELPEAEARGVKRGAPEVPEVPEELETVPEPEVKAAKTLSIQETRAFAEIAAGISAEKEKLISFYKESGISNLINKMVQYIPPQYLSKIIDEKLAEKTPLMWAVLNRDLDTVQKLINVGANPNLFAGDSSELVGIGFDHYAFLTTLAMAIKLDFPEIVRILLTSPIIDPNLADDLDEKTTLRLAVRLNNEEIIGMLLDSSKIDIDYPDDKGRTALMQAAKQSPSIAALLVKKGAEVDQIDKEGKSAIDYAKKARLEEKDKEKIITLLKNAGAVDSSEEEVEEEK